MTKWCSCFYVKVTVNAKTLNVRKTLAGCLHLFLSSIMQNKVLTVEITTKATVYLLR